MLPGGAGPVHRAVAGRRCGVGNGRGADIAFLASNWPLPPVHIALIAIHSIANYPHSRRHRHVWQRHATIMQLLMLHEKRQPTFQRSPRAAAHGRDGGARHV